MFGKTKERTDGDDVDLAIDEFFGDEAAAAEAERVEELRRRVESVEQQISSQFTSMAAYAQIAQEQIELVRSEAHHATERSERRVTGLIERERADRLGDDATGRPVAERLDELEAQVTDIRASLQQCLTNQKALADAIIDLFQPGSPVVAATGDPSGSGSAPAVDADGAMPSPDGAAVPAPPPPAHASAIVDAPPADAGAAVDAGAVPDPSGGGEHDPTGDAHDDGEPDERGPIGELSLD